MLSYREMQNLLRYAREHDVEYTGFIPKLNSTKEVLFSACCDYQAFVLHRNNQERKQEQQQKEQASSTTQDAAQDLVNGVDIWAVASDSIYFLSHCQKLFGTDKPSIKKVWRSIVMTYHPDHGGQHETFCQLNEMYQKVLSYC